MTGPLLIGIIAYVTRTPVIGGSAVCAASVDKLTDGDFGLRNVDGTRLTEFSEVHVSTANCQRWIHAVTLCLF